jgi:hypothetical protein
MNTKSTKKSVCFRWLKFVLYALLPVFFNCYLDVYDRIFCDYLSHNYVIHPVFYNFFCVLSIPLAVYLYTSYIVLSKIKSFPQSPKILSLFLIFIIAISYFLISFFFIGMCLFLQNGFEGMF